MAITDWPEGERPGRGSSNSARGLSDAELLAIYLRVGVRGKSAVDLARDLLQRYRGRLEALVEAPLADLAQVPGIGVAKAAQLKASFELARRALAQDPPAGTRSRPRLSARLAAPAPRRPPPRSFRRSLARRPESPHPRRGTFSAAASPAPAFTREVVKAALARNAAAVILAHNHPSGWRNPRGPTSPSPVA